MILMILLWIDFAFLCQFMTRGITSIYFAKLGYGSAAIFFIPFNFFTNAFFVFKKEKINILSSHLINWLIIIIAVFSSIFAVFTNFVVKDMIITSWGNLPVISAGAILYFIFIFVLACFITLKIIIGYFKILPNERTKVQYFILGLFIFISFNLIFNVIMPFWQKMPQYYQFGNYSAIFLMGFTAYAIIKQELFGINVILTSLFVGFIAILLSLDTLLFTENRTIQLLKWIILVIFVYFGYVLIKSTLQEIETRKEVERISKAKTEFISIASHQLRTPLTAIKGYLSMILEGSYGKLSGKIRKPIENIYDSNERLIKLVNDILNLSRIETGRVEMELHEASVEDLILNTVNELSIQAKKKNIDLIWEKPKKPLPKMLIDVEKMRQVIMNIIDNAIKYTTEGSVTITTTIIDKEYKERKDVLIEIKDTGEGMADGEKEHLFESFSRGKAGQKMWTEGSGVGLYVAKKFVEMHNGKIWAESKGRGKGTTFSVEFPVKSGDMEQFLKKF